MAIVRIIPFIVAALIILLGGHFVLYKSAVRFFDISRPDIKNILALGLICLSLSFIAASLSGRWLDNLFIRLFYGFSGIWLGLLLYLLLASAAIWLSISISRFSGVSINIFAIALFVFILAGAYAMYGVKNAFNPLIKNIEVKIKNLPPQWQDRTIVQLSDIHLGHVHRLGFLQKIVEQTNALKPDIIFITGDLFDGMGDSLNEFVPPLNNLTAPQGIFFITGNHETYLGLPKALAILEKTKIKILNDELVDLDGLQLIGISYPEMNEQKDVKNILGALKDFNPAKPNILLYHPPLPSQIKEAKELGIDFQLSGHTHKGQVFPFNFITKLVYKGYDYGLHQEGDFSIYTTNGIGTWGPPLRTGNQPEIAVVKLINKD